MHWQTVLLLGGAAIAINFVASIMSVMGNNAIPYPASREIANRAVVNHFWNFTGLVMFGMIFALVTAFLK